DLRDPLPVHPQVHGELVPAQRVPPEGGPVRGLQLVEVPRVLAVVQDHFLVQGLQVRHQWASVETDARETFRGTFIRPPAPPRCSGGGTTGGRRASPASRGRGRGPRPPGRTRMSGSLSRSLRRFRGI